MGIAQAGIADMVDGYRFQPAALTESSASIGSLWILQ